jgi:tRNA U34 5-carboxymethylaminomethyl modifying GTPase MnmE/TrmE
MSGPRVPDIARQMIGQLPTPRYAFLGDFVDAAGEAIDRGIALYFPAPHSFTGEDVLELQGHGGIFILQRLLGRALELGARHAQPGEFSQRAFLNDKLDLVQAEAIADLIESGSEAAARAAQRTLQGVFSEQVHDFRMRRSTLLPRVMSPIVAANSANGWPACSARRARGACCAMASCWPSSVRPTRASPAC